MAEGRWENDDVTGKIRLGPGTTYIRGVRFESTENVRALFPNGEPAVMCIFMRHPSHESDELHYKFSVESTAIRTALIRGTTGRGQRTLPFEVLDVIKTQGPVDAYVVLRAPHNNTGRYQHNGSYIVCYRHSESLRRLKAQFRGHGTIVVEDMANGTVFKDYSYNKVAPSLQQKVGRDCYYTNVEDTAYSQNAREYAATSEMSWPVSRCNLCNQLGHMQACCMFRMNKLEHWLQTGSLACCTRCGGMHDNLDCLAVTTAPLSAQANTMLKIADEAVKPVIAIVEHAQTHKAVIANMALAVQDAMDVMANGTTSTTSEDMKFTCPLLQPFAGIYPDDADLSDGGMTIGATSHDDLHNTTLSVLEHKGPTIYDTVLAQSVKETADPTNSILSNTFGTAPLVNNNPVIATNRKRRHEPVLGKDIDTEMDAQIRRAFELRQAREAAASAAVTTPEDDVVRSVMHNLG